MFSSIIRYIRNSIVCKMKVLVSLEVENCKDCPHYNYEGTSWSEDIYTCNKTGKEVEPNGVSHTCPFIPTMDKLLESYNKLENIKKQNGERGGGYEPGVDSLWPIQ